MYERLNLLSTESLADPYPAYTELRRGPVRQIDPGGFWALSRHDDVMMALQDAEAFSSEGFRRVTKPAWLGHNPFADSMISLDPPTHGRLRALVSRAFAPAALTRLEARVRDFAEATAEALPLGEEVEWVSHFALHVPSSVIGELLGLDPTLNPLFRRWADDLTSISVVTPDQGARMSAISASVREAEQYMTDVLISRRRRPGDDMVSDLLAARVEGQALTDMELMSFMFLLLVAGLETTVHLLNHATRALVAWPEVFSRVRADLSLLPRLVDEVLRYEPPVRGIYRLTTREVAVGGARIPRGSRVLVLLGSAARDEAYLPDADRFDLDRASVTSLPFGHGIHFCIGAALARIEARLAFTALLPKIRGLSAAGPVTWRRSLSVRGPVSMPIMAHPAG
jgi:cytochrome P450